MINNGSQYALSGGSLTINGSLTNEGTYVLSGGTLQAGYLNVGSLGTGVFTQSGGSNSLGALYLGNHSTDYGTYNLTGNVTAAGSLSAATEYVGYSGTGAFIQSAGTNTVSVALLLGFSPGSTGTYNLSGTGALSAPSEYIGGYDFSSAGTAAFRQTGGTNSVTDLMIGAGSQYLLSGGTLTVSSIMVNNGTIDGGSGPATLSATCLVDLTSGTWKNYSGWSVNLGPGSLLIVPSGFNTATGFAGFTDSGLPVHVLGTTLTVPAGQSFSGMGQISDPVVCQGTIAGSINLNNGLALSGNGSVATVSLTVNDMASGISGGTLEALRSEYIGNGGTGAFTHSAGTNNVGTALYLGYNPSDAGTYHLSGTGTLLASSTPDNVTAEYVGYSGMGTFSQSGGSNNLGGLYVGYNSTAVGTYNLSGGALSAPYYYNGNTAAVVVGYWGVGTFNQSGGTNSILGTGGAALFLAYASTAVGTYNLTGGAISCSYGYEAIGCRGTGIFTQWGGANSMTAGFPGDGLVLGGFSGGNGTYNLNGGTLVTPAIYQGPGTAAFNFGGGTLEAGAAFTATLPMTLTGTGGNANIDTNGYAVTLSGACPAPAGSTNSAPARLRSPAPIATKA